MISHERRLPPMRFWVALCFCSGGCEVHEAVWNGAQGTPVEHGKAVVPWNDAQLVGRPEDGDAAAPTVVDASASGTDASVRDASPADAATSDAALDAGTDSATDAPDDLASGTDARCIFRVTTLPLGGRYAPKNVAAIWVERTDGTWIKTLAVWAGVRLRYLTGYRRANPTGNKVDAVTSATLPAFGPRVVSWNMADAQGQEVPDGDYAVKMEVTDRDAAGQIFTFPFSKTRPPFSSTTGDTQYYTGAELRCR